MLNSKIIIIIKLHKYYFIFFLIHNFLHKNKYKHCITFYVVINIQNLSFFNGIKYLTTHLFR